MVLNLSLESCEQKDKGNSTEFDVAIRPKSINSKDAVNGRVSQCPIEYLVRIEHMAYLLNHSIVCHVRCSDSERMRNEEKREEKRFAARMRAIGNINIIIVSIRIWTVNVFCDGAQYSHTRTNVLSVCLASASVRLLMAEYMHLKWSGAVPYTHRAKLCESLPFLLLHFAIANGHHLPPLMKYSWSTFYAYFSVSSSTFYFGPFLMGTMSICVRVSV